MRVRERDERRGGEREEGEGGRGKGGERGKGRERERERERSVRECEREYIVDCQFSPRRIALTRWYI